MDPITVASIFCESLFYGVYCVVVLAVLYILFTARDLLISHKILFLISITTFLLATVHIVLALITDIQVTPSIHYTQAEVAIAQFEGLLGDSVIIWRVWVVWKRSLYVVALPIAATIAAFGKCTPRIHSRILILPFKLSESYLPHPLHLELRFAKFYPCLREVSRLSTPHCALD